MICRGSFQNSRITWNGELRHVGETMLILSDVVQIVGHGKLQERPHVNSSSTDFVHILRLVMAARQTVHTYFSP